MNQNLIQSARKLRLSGLLVSLEMRLQEATSHQLSAEQFLELVLQDELNVRAHRRVERRKKAAAFRELKPLDEFDWTSILRSNAPRSMSWPLPTSSAKTGTSSCSGHPGSEKVVWLRPSVTRRSRLASSPSIARCSIWSAICKPSNR